MLTAAELYERGVVLSNAGRYAAARRSLELARHRGPDADLGARIDGTRAYILSETGDPAEAVALCRSALDVPGLKPHTIAVLRGQLGLIELRRGDIRTALPLLADAGDQLTAEPELAGSIDMNRGICHLELGHLDEADRSFASAATRFSIAGLPADVAKAQHNRGYTALLRGDLVSALSLMDEARPVAAAGSPVDAAVGDADRAEVLLAAGLPVEASSALTAAARTFGSRRLRQPQADAEWALARTLLYSDPRAAATTARRASRRYAGRGNSTGALRAEATALRAEVEAGSSTDMVVENLRAVSTALSRRGLADESRVSRVMAARVSLRRGDPDRARRELRGVRIPPDGPIITRTLAREVRAETASAAGDLRESMRAAAAGLDDLRDWQAVFGSLDLQSSLTMHGQGLTRIGISAALQTAEVETVLEWSERARLLADHAVAPRPSEDAATAVDLAELRQLRFEGDLTGAAARRDAEIRERIRRRSWTAAGSPDPQRLATVGEVRGRLGTDTALVAYLWSGDRLAALIVGGSDARVLDLGPLPDEQRPGPALQADLDMHAARLPGGLGTSIAHSLADRLAALARHLIDPVLADPIFTGMPNARVVLTAPGVLAGVPWSMLPGLTGRIVTMPTSVTRWLAQRVEPYSALTRIGLVAGPAVPRAVEEVGLCAAEWGARDAATLVPGAATTAAASALAQDSDVLHLTGHGRHATDSPYFSGIELDDGPWFGHDIARLPRVPRLVILSACELGRSSVHWGHEALGMARTWLQAGSGCVIASPANVNDDAACELLPAVHALLARGSSPAEALAAASRSTGVTAPFLCYGAGW